MATQPNKMARGEKCSSFSDPTTRLWKRITSFGSSMPSKSGNSAKKAKAKSSKREEPESIEAGINRLGKSKRNTPICDRPGRAHHVAMYLIGLLVAPEDVLAETVAKPVHQIMAHLASLKTINVQRLYDRGSTILESASEASSSRRQSSSSLPSLPPSVSIVHYLQTIPDNSRLAKSMDGIKQATISQYELTITPSQSKLSQDQLSELQRSTHFDKKELQQWYKGMCHHHLSYTYTDNNKAS